MWGGAGTRACVCIGELPLKARTPLRLARRQTIGLVRRPDSIDEGKNGRTHARSAPLQ